MAFAAAHQIYLIPSCRPVWTKIGCPIRLRSRSGPVVHNPDRSGVQSTVEFILPQKCTIQTGLEDNRMPNSSSIQIWTGLFL